MSVLLGEKKKKRLKTSRVDSWTECEESCIRLNTVNRFDCNQNWNCLQILKADVFSYRTIKFSAYETSFSIFIFMPTIQISLDKSSIKEGFLLSLFSTTHCSLLRLIVRSGLEVPTFATRRLHACHHARAPSGGRWNCGRKMSENFALMPTSTLHLRIFYMP
jgi:hypothetical protein